MALCGRGDCRQRVPETSTIGISKSIVENDRSVETFIAKEIGKRYSSNNRNLFARPHADAFIRFHIQAALKAFDPETFVKSEARTWEYSIQVRLHPRYNRLKEALVGRFLDCHYGLSEHPQCICLISSRLKAESGKHQLGLRVGILFSESFVPESFHRTPKSVDSLSLIRDLLTELVQCVFAHPQLIGRFVGICLCKVRKSFLKVNLRLLHIVLSHRHCSVQRVVRVAGPRLLQCDAGALQFRLHNSDLCFSCSEPISVFFARIAG